MQKIWWSIALVALLVGSASCSGKSETPCADVECDRGRCSTETGACENASTCFDDAQCLEGWSCLEDACIADVPCSDDAPCERGVCEAGACINAEACSGDEDCVAGFDCANGRCAEDPCGGIDCVRGVCNPSSATCVNSDVCTTATQASDCLDGYYCYGQSCESAERICADVECARGVCDPSTGDCVEAEVCAADVECLEGSYCDSGACVANQCDEQMRECARGVCQRDSARCENPEVCTTFEECVDGFSCVDGACVPTGSECGVECLGTQECVYEASSISSMCVEGTRCFAARDCLGTRVCDADGLCGAPTPCEDDDLEPNDASASATPISELDNNLAVASICGTDVDFYRFHTDDSELFRGVFLAELAIAPIDVGAGSLTLTVTGPDGVPQSVDTDADGVARVTLDVGVLDLGAYEVRVQGAEVGAGGLRYTLFADLLDQPTLDACAAPVPLGPAGATGSTTSGSSYLLSSVCGEADNIAGEDIYSFSVNEASWVTLATTSPLADVIISLQHRCESASVVECVSNAGTGGVERLEAEVGPGDYFVIVEGASPSSGGDYELTFAAEPIICRRGDATCVDEDTSRFCNAQGTGHEEEPCDNGCSDATGRCEREPRDTCFVATDASGGISDQVDWEQLQNDYDPGAGGCVPDNGGTQTAGPDAAYFVSLPPGYVLQATQSLGSGDRGSLYLVEDCGNVATSCIAAANETIGLLEELVYFNTTDDTQDLYLIADTEADSFGYNIGNINITVQETVCTPGEIRCDGTDRAEVCQELGTGWDSEYCSFGCSAGVCNTVTNNDCATALDLVANGPFTGRIDEYSRNYSLGLNSCVRRSTSGPEAFFSVTPAASEIARVTVNAGFDAGLWVITDCADAAGSCVAGADTSQQTSEMVEFVGDGTTTYYVGVDSQFNGSGIFTVEAQLLQPTCTPGVVLGCSSSTTLEYCSELGVEAQYRCSTTCTAGACDDPIGQLCADAIVLTDGQTYTGTLDVPNTVDPGIGDSGSCNFPSDANPYGSDVIFAVDLVAGDWLFATHDVNSSLALSYVLTDCGETDSCVARSPEGGDETVIYEAQADERVYLVLDRTTTSVSSVDYSITVDIRRQDCVPGSPPYCSNSTTIGYCDNLGFTLEHACNGTCSAGRCDTPAGDVCVDAIPVNAGDVVSGDFSNGTNSIEPQGILVGACEFDDSAYLQGREDVYVINLAPGDLLRATLDTNYGASQHYILTDCLDAQSCVDANFDRGPGDVQYFSQNGGPVYVVVDTISSGTSTSPYDLTFDVTTGGACAPGTASCAGGLLERCDLGGAIEPSILCAAGCETTEACTAEPVADACVTAPLTTGTRVYVDLDDLTNDVEIASSGCTGYTGSGADIVHAVSAGPGEIIHATVKSLGRESVQLYIMTDCADPTASCVAGERGNTSTYFAEVYYAAPATQTYYVVAESTSSFSDEPILVDIEVLLPECTPGDYQCAPSGQAMLVCNDLGIWDPYPCDGGCAANQCVQPRGQACFDAIPMNNGDSHSGVFNEPADINPGSGQVGACNFGSTGAPGSDTVYSVEMLEGDILTLNYTSGSSFGFVYMLGDCADTNTCLATSDDGTTGSLSYIAPQDQTVYFVMDRTTGGSTTLSYTVSVELLSPDCTPGSPPVCSDASTLSYCDALGFSRSFTCGGMAGTCTNAACDTPTAEVCVDAGVLTDGAHIVGDFLGADDSSPGVGTNGACVFPSGDAAEGVDHFYNVSLSAGEWLIADYTTSTTSAIAYLLGTCGDVSSCRAVTAEGADGRLAYRAQVDEELTFVMDRTSTATSAATWELDVTIGAPSCTTGETRCADGTTLEWCNAYGLYEQHTCASTCTTGACDQPSSDICADPIVLTNGMTVMDDFGGSNSQDLGEGSVGTCSFASGDEQPGTDHFYQIDLLAGQTATVDWTSTSSYGIVYFTRNCLVPSQCVDNSASGTSGTLTHTANTDETVFLVVDRTLSGVSTSLGYELELTIN